MDDDPGHSCGSLLRLCAICSTFIHPTFGCCCESCTPFSYSSSAEPIRLSVQPCVYPSLVPVSVVTLHGKGSSQSALEPGQSSLQASAQHGCCSMSLADGNRLACWQGSLCRGVLCLHTCHQAGVVLALQEHSMPETLHPSDCLFLSQCWSS